VGKIQDIDFKPRTIPKRNARKKWPVARLGCYQEAASNYNWVANGRIRGHLLKALTWRGFLDNDGTECSRFLADIANQPV